MTSVTPKRRGKAQRPDPSRHDATSVPPVRWASGSEVEDWPKDWGPAATSALEPLLLSDLPGPAHGVGVDEDLADSDGVECERPELADDADDGGEDAGAGDSDRKSRGRRRSKTIARKQMLRERRRMLAQGTVPEIVDYDRPIRRSECREDRRPCLYVSCRYHLYLDVNPMTGSIKLNFPDREVWELEETCALDVAERGGITLEEVGEIMNLTRERIRQVEVSGLEKLKDGEADLHTFIDGRELEVGPRTGAKSLPIVDD